MTDRMPKFLVVGSGGVGGFFGGKVANAGNDVWFLARGEHLRAMKERGLQIHSSEGSWIVPPGQITDTPVDAGIADVILFCVKSYDTEDVARQIIPNVGEETLIVSLQNGVDNEAKIKVLLPKGEVLGGVAFVYATITSPGVITETGGIKKLTFGSFDNSHRSVQGGKLLLKILQEAGVSAEYTPDITSALWKKFIFITAIAGLTAMTRLTLGQILDVEPSRRLLIAAMTEAFNVAKARGANLEKDFVEKTLGTVRGMKGDTYSSLFYDLTHGKPMEVEALSGTILRYGRMLEIETPVHETIYASLLPHHLRHVAERKK
ncbi:MAG TPA: 2-dehydropantoate 2-reductase [Bacteroidota bacterium]